MQRITRPRETRDADLARGGRNGLRREDLLGILVARIFGGCGSSRIKILVGFRRESDIGPYLGHGFGPNFGNSSEMSNDETNDLKFMTMVPVLRRYS